MINNGYNKEMIELYQRLNELQKDNITHYLALKACINLKDYKIGCNIHKSLKLSDTKKDEIKIKTQLIDFYGIFGDVSNALNVFNLINKSHLDIVCIGAMLKTFVNNGFYRKTIELYDKIDCYSSFINKDDGCHVLAIKACSNLKDIDKGKQIFNKIPKNQRNNINIITAFIDFYGQCSEIQNAINIFKLTPKHKQNIVFINSMLTAYVNNGYYDAALQLYDKIGIDDDMKKSDTSHVMAITACSKGNKFDKGRNLYFDQIDLKQNENVLVKTSLIDLFGNMKDIKTALNIYNSIKDSKMNIITINAMMTALINNEYNEEAIKIYKTINSNRNYNHITPDATTYLLAIKASSVANIEQGKKIYDKIPEHMIDILIQTAMIQLYGEGKDIKNAINIFNHIPDDKKTIVTINTMLSAYINNGYDKQALKLYDEIDDNTLLKYKHIKKDNVLFSVEIKACTNSNNLDKGIQIHNEIKKSMDNNNDDTQVHLINMYSKNGMINVCDEIFDEMRNKKHYKYLSDINIWNEMINGYLRYNNIYKAKKLLLRMKNETNLIPNHKTYSLLLNGCSHIGDINTANDIWSNQITDNSIKYDSYIIGTLVDGCARKGFLYTGYEWIYKYELVHNKKANKNIDYAMWMSLLHGCRQENNLLLAQYIYKQILDRFKYNQSLIDSAHVLLSNIENQ